MQVSQRNVEGQQAYILFYLRRHRKAPLPSSIADLLPGTAAAPLEGAEQCCGNAATSAAPRSAAAAAPAAATAEGRVRSGAGAGRAAARKVPPGSRQARGMQRPGNADASSGGESDQGSASDGRECAAGVSKAAADPRGGVSQHQQEQQQGEQVQGQQQQQGKQQQQHGIRRSPRLLALEVHEGANGPLAVAAAAAAVSSAAGGARCEADVASSSAESLVTDTPAGSSPGAVGKHERWAAGQLPCSHFNMKQLRSAKGGCSGVGLWV